MYTPRETPQSQYFNYSGLNVQPKGDLPLVGDMASKLDTGKLTWNTVYADPTNKDTSNYAEIVTVSVGVTKPPEKTLVNNAKTLNKVKNGTDPDSGKNWEQRFNEANDVYELLDLSEQRALMRQYRNDHPGATDNEIRDHVRANKAQYRDQFKKQAKKNALAESGKAKFSVSVQVLLQFEYKYDPVKKEHYYSGGQYIINCTGEVQKTFYWLVAGVPLFVNVKGSGSVQLDGRYATLKEQLRAKDLGYESDLTEIIPTETPWIQVTFGLSLQPGVGICGVLSVRGILQFTFWARTATSKVASGSSGGTMGVFQGGFGVDLIVFSFEKTWDIGSWRTGVFDKQGKLGTQSAGESDGSNITMYLRNFDNGEEVPPPLKINSTLLPEAKKTLINGAPEYIRPQIINLDNGELLLLFLRNMEGEVNALGEARNKDNATALQYAIRKKDGTYDTDENGNIRSNTIETDNNADSTLSAVKSGDKVYIAWSDSKVEAGSAQEFELAKKSLTSTSIHMAVYDIAAGKMSDVITVVDDSFVNSHVFLTEEGDNIALYYFKKDLSKAGNIEELAGVQNNYNTWARKVYDPKTGGFVKLMPDRPDPYEELIAISHPGITDPLVLDLNAEDFEYTDISGAAKDYRILSYTVDRDGNYETATDKELWVQLENLTDARTYYPVCLDAGGHTIDDPELFEMKDDVYLAWLTDGSVYNTLSAHDVFKGLDMENGTETGALGENGTPDTTITRSIERIRGLSKEDISKYGWNSLPYKQVETVDNARELYTLLYKLSEGELRTTHKDFGETSENGERISNILTEHQIVPGADGNLYLFWTGQDGSDLKNDQGRELYGAALYLNDGEDGARGWSNAVKLTDYGEVIDELSVEVAGDENAVLVGNMYTQKAQEKGGVEYGPHKLVQIDFKPGNSLAVEDAYFEFSDPYPVEGQIVEASIPIVNNGLLPARRYKLTVNGSSETAEDVIWPGETIEVTRQFKVDSEESLTVSAQINELDEIQELAVKDDGGNQASITTDSRAVFDFGEPVIYDVDSDIFGTYMDQDVDEALSSDESLHACLKDSVNDDDEDEKGRIGAILDWIISDDYKPSDLVICVPVTNIGNLKGNNLKAKATALLFDDEGMHEAGVIGEGTLVTVPVKKADENGEAVTETVYMVIPLTGFDAAAHMDEMGNMEVRLDFTLDGEEISDTAHAKRQFVTNVEMKLASGARKLNLAVDQDYDLSSAIIARPWDQVKELSFESEDETVAMVSNDGFVYGVSEGTTNIYVYDDYSDIMMTLPVTVSAEPVYSVTFDLNGQGGVYRTQEVGQGEKALRPGDPVCEGYIFGGWYTDAACEDKDFYSFDTPVTKDLLLYAKWTSIQPFNVHFKGIAADPYEGLWYNSQTKRYETVYTGYYIRPGVTVTGADGRILTEGTDYRVKYLNNRKASLEGNATVVIKGLGMYTGTLELPFHIEKADLNELKNRKLLNLSTAFAVKQGDKLNPVISYGTYVLKKSDHTLSLTGVPTQDTVTDISGTGRNFTGTIEAFPVKVLSKQEADRMSVKVTLVPVEHVYDGSRQLLSSSELSVTSAGTGESLRLNEDYSVTYYNNVEAGKARVVVTGINGYTGSVTKSFKIKSDRDSAVAVALADPDTPVYHTQGGAKPELSVTVTRSGEAYELRAGVDYKVTYSKNKKAGEGRYTVKFLNNYKGRTAVTGTYEIKARPLSMDGLTVFAGDLIYTRPAKYRVNPFVLYENARLEKKNYTLRYFDGERELAAGEKISLAEGENQKTITVLIEGKGNYTDSVRTTYNLVRSETAIDLSRAKIYAKDTMKRVGRQGYTGSPIEPQIDVYAKQNGELKLVDPDYYTVAYTDNINRGTATIVINGDISNAMGSRTGTFKIKRGILKELFSNL